MALEELCGPNAASRAAELAHHFAEAETVTGAERLVRYSRLAGEQALAAYAHEEALGHFQRALLALEGQPMDAQKAALLSGLGRAQAATLERQRMGEVVATLCEAFDYYAEAGDVHTLRTVSDEPSVRLAVMDADYILHFVDSPGSRRPMPT